MDRRTFILFLLLAAGLIAVNAFFEYNYQEKVRLWQTQQEGKRRQLEQEIAKRTVPPQDLPLVWLYSDEALQNRIALGARSGNAIAALPFSSSLPNVLYAPSLKGGVPSLVKRQYLAQEDRFGIYSTSSEAKFDIGELQREGHYELQLAFPSSTALSLPTTTLAEYAEGNVTLSLDNLKKVYGGEFASPAGSALAFMSSDRGYLPVGIYDSDSHLFLSFDTGDNSHIEAKQQIIAPASTDGEHYYLLENSFQQLVFSTRGGALTEINLSLKGKEYPHSIVKPIDFDREIVERSPENGYFPLHPYFTAPSSPGMAPVEHSKGQLGGYYPLLRRDLQRAHHLQRIPAHCYATNVISEYPEVAELIYRVKEFTKEKITFEAVQPHRRITKSYTLNAEDAPYCFSLTIQVDGDARGLWLTSGVPEVELISNSPSPVLKYRITRQGASEVKQIELPTEVVSYSQIRPDWLCNSNGFFGIISDPLLNSEGGFRAQHVPGEMAPSRLTILDSTYMGREATPLPGYMELLPLKAQAGSVTFRFFAGPFATELLKTIDLHYSDPETGYNPDYIASQSFHGWFEVISGPFSKFLFLLMSFFQSWTGSWGLAIILLTVALRLMLYPLNAWSIRSSTKMQSIAPQLAALREKYKKDPKKVQAEEIKFYRENNINPVSGCLPMIIQLPFLMGMFDLLKSTFELRGASFVPGWIDNLAAPDVLFSWNMTLPFIGNEFHLLPVLSGAVMLWQQRLMSPSPQDPSQMGEKERQQRTMGTIFAGFFALMFYQFSSGLNLYWISSSLLGIVQQWWSRRSMARVLIK